jgi:hypothetical protein
VAARALTPAGDGRVGAPVGYTWPMTEQHPEYDDESRPETPADIAQEVEHDLFPDQDGANADDVLDEERLDRTDRPDLA